MCKILYEDNHLLVVEKPPGMLTQGDITGDDCLVESMKRHIGLKHRKPGAVYLGLVHRLDRPVGGLIVLARTSKAAGRLSQQLREHSMEREYLAVVHGCHLPDSGKLTDTLALDERSGNMRVVPQDAVTLPGLAGPDGLIGPDASRRLTCQNGPAGQQAVLRFVTLARDQQLSRALVHVQLETGRKHQIRIQLAHLGHPIIQDMRYGKDAAGEPIALWGAVLRLIHPTLQKPMIFTSHPQGKAFERFASEIDAFVVLLHGG